jgi:hypothetical protein
VTPGSALPFAQTMTRSCRQRLRRRRGMRWMLSARCSAIPTRTRTSHSSATRRLRCRCPCPRRRNRRPYAPARHAADSQSRSRTRGVSARAKTPDSAHVRASKLARRSPTSWLRDSELCSCSTRELAVYALHIAPERSVTLPGLPQARITPAWPRQHSPSARPGLPSPCPRSHPRPRP